MYNRGNRTLLVVSLVFVLGTLACSMGRFLPNFGVETPKRRVQVSATAAAEAKTRLDALQDGGTVRLTEAQFNSLLVQQLQENSNGDLPLEDMTIWFEPGKVYLQARAKEGEVGVGGTLTMAGQLSATAGQLTLAIDEASIGGVKVPGSVLEMLNSRLRDALRRSDFNQSHIQSITVEQGAIVIQRTP